MTSPTLRRRRLGNALRELRDAAGLNREQVGEALDCSGSKITRIEAGDVGVRRGDLVDMLNLYGLTDEAQRAEFVALAKESKQRTGWWRKLGDLPLPYLKLIELETVARSIRTSELMVVPGVLQTEAYARAVIHEAGPTRSDEEVEERVTARMARKEAMFDREDPVEFWAILDEAVLHRRIGGARVLADQLHYLAQLNGRPGITIQMLPFDHGGHEAMKNAFSILRFAEPRDPDLVYLELSAGDIYLDDVDDVARSSLIFDHLVSAALSKPQTTKRFREEVRRLTAD